MAKVSVDPVTVIGLGLLAMPLTAMLHEIGGHAAMCVALGHHVTELGAFYVECDAVRGSAVARAVALAGPGIDLVLGMLLAPLWPRLRGDLPRLLGWYAFLCLLFDASGYMLFSGVTGVGDLSPVGDGGIAPLAMPWLWRGALALVGAAIYSGVIRVGMARLGAMIGQGPETRTPRRWIAHGFYATICGAAMLASIPNPIGLFITLVSAAASSIGGKAGLISIGYATADAGEPRDFVIARSWGVLAAGVVLSLAFAVVLGPTLRFAVR